MYEDIISPNDKDESYLKSFYSCEYCNTTWFINELKEFDSCPWCDKETKAEKEVEKIAKEVCDFMVNYMSEKSILRQIFGVKEYVKPI